MNNSKKRVALIYGGVGKEHDVSVMSAEYLRELIDPDEYELLPIFIDKNGKWYLTGNRENAPISYASGGLTVGDTPLRVDVAFPILHGDGGEDGCIAGTLKMAGIRFVGCDVGASAVAYDKAITKLVAERLGIPTAKWILRVEDDTHHPGVEDAEAVAGAMIGYPMFIKPSGLGSSVGAHAVMTPARFDAAYTDACIKGGGRVLVEEYIGEKRELECAFFKTRDRRIFAHPGEVVCHGPYSYEEKYNSSSHAKTVARADVPEAVSSLAIRYSEMLADAIGFRHLSRIDFFLTDRGLIFNEINTMPGFTAASLYPRMMGEAGIAPRELVRLLIEDACL